MKLLLLKDSRIRHNAGETVEVSLAEADFLISTGSAVPAPAAERQEHPAVEKPETPEKKAAKPETRKKTAK